MHSFIRGACMVLFGGGACVVLFRGGMHGFIRGCVRGFIRGGMRGFIRGACMVFFGGHAWFYSGGVHGFIPGGHAWFYLGGMRVFFSFFGYNEIRSMSGRYASYWNAFLFPYLLASVQIRAKRSINRSQLSGDKQHLLRHLSIIRHVTSNVSERNYGPSSEPVH